MSPNSGAQRKTTHNIRLLCGNPLDLCRHKTTTMRGVVVPHPERLQTAMSLYSPKLSALVLMVDGRVSLLGGLKEGVCVCLCMTQLFYSFSTPNVVMATLIMSKSQYFMSPIMVMVTSN